jgi:predicted Zn-dependent protease
LAAALTRLGRLEEAEAALEQGLAAFPYVPDNWLQLGQVQVQLGKFAEAESSLLRAIQDGGTSESIYFLLATATARQGKSEAAAEYRQEFTLRKARSAPGADQPFQLRYDAEMRRIAVSATCQAGAIHGRQGSADEAERLLLRALHLDPANPVVCGELAMFYRGAGRMGDALVLHHRLVEIEPENAAHYANLASISLQLGDFDLAERTLKELIGRRPDVSLGYSSLAQLYLHAGRFEPSRRYAELALRQQTIAPDERIRTCHVLAEACRRMGDVAAAESALARVRQPAP